jgi:phosphonate metabolism-associated iron-containing alcohol dehydrogenase
LSWHFHNPVAVHFGAGVIDKLASLLPDGPVALILYPQASDELRQQLKAILGRRHVHLIDDVPSNPTLQWCERQYARMHGTEQPPIAVIALGGGSVIDAGKTLAVCTASGSFHEVEQHLYHGGQAGILGSLPLYVLPTTAGTGSEVTPWATVWDFQAANGRGAKYSLHLPSSFAQAALVDPLLSLGLPVEAMRNSALDALSHSLEAIWNVNANPVSDNFAVAAARGVIEHIEAAFANPRNLAARSALSQAALLAGLAFSNTKTALAHSLSYPMTLKHGLPHGLACSFTLPMVWTMAVGHSAERDRLLGEIFFTPPLVGAERLHRLLVRLGVATNFADYGVGVREAAEMLRDAMDGVRGRNFIGRLTPSVEVA